MPNHARIVLISTPAPKRCVAVVRRIITCGPTRGSVRAGFYAISNAQGCAMGETLAEGCRGVKTRTGAAAETLSDALAHPTC